MGVGCSGMGKHGCQERDPYAAVCHYGVHGCLGLTPSFPTKFTSRFSCHLLQKALLDSLLHLFSGSYLLPSPGCEFIPISMTFLVISSSTGL